MSNKENLKLINSILGLFEFKVNLLNINTFNQLVIVQLNCNIPFQSLIVNETPI